MNNIATALLAAQKQIRHAQQDAENPHFKSDYASLESVINAVKPAANNNGIVIFQTSGRDSFGDFLQTTLLHESGEKITSHLYLTLEKPTMQSLGSAISYARRYSLSSIFSIGQKDDDGEELRKAEPKEVKSIVMPILTPKTLTNPSGYPDTIGSELFDNAPETENPAPAQHNGSYICPLGKNKGKTLDDMGMTAIQNLYNYLIETSAKEGKPLKGSAADFVIQAVIYGVKE